MSDLPEDDTPEEMELLEEVSPGLSLPVRRKNRGGRPPKYRPEYAKATEIMLRRGATIGELAEAFGVTNSTIHAWRNQHQEFSDKFSESDIDVMKGRIIRSLAELASGYTQETVKVFSHKGIPVVVPIREHVPPSFAAIKHFLAVKDPAVWQIKEAVELSGDEAFKALWAGLADRKKEEK